MKFALLNTIQAVVGCLAILGASSFGAVVISADPASITPTDNTKAVLSVTATSDAGKTLSYLWQKQNGANWDAVGTESSSNQLVFSSVKTTNNGVYRVYIRELGAGGTDATSNTATLTVVVRPTISVHPTAPTVPPVGGRGQSVDLTVTLSAGSPQFVYTWQKKSGAAYTTYSIKPPSSALTDTLTIPNVTHLEAGIYRVVVSNGSTVVATSKDVVLKVNYAPVITVQPAAAPIVTFGATGTLKVTAIGNTPLTYRWLKNGVVIPKSNSPTLTIKGTDRTDAGVAEGPGTYLVQIVNEFSENFGSKANPFNEGPMLTPATVTGSNPSTVVVIRKPKITTQPQKATLNITGAGPFPAHTLSVIMDDSGNPGTRQYQWFKDNKPILGAIASTLVFNPVQWSDRGTYKVTIRNEVGTVTSATAAITIISPPIITAPLAPTDVFGPVGGSVKLSVVATGSTPLTYEWRYRPVGAVNFNPNPIARTPTLTLSKLSNANQQGDYQCTVKNAIRNATPGEALSPIFYVQADEAPKITGQTRIDGVNTTSTGVIIGNKLNLLVTASGTNRTVDDVPPGTLKANPLVYQWLFNNVPISNGAGISGADTNSLMIDPAQAVNSGKYSCRVSNRCGVVTSNALTITVSGPPTITTHPPAATGQEETKIETSVVATGTPPLKYKWQKQLGGSWVDVSGQTTNKLSFASATVLNGGTYRCLVSNNFSGTTPTASNPVEVTVNPIPAPTIGPVAGKSTVEFYPTIARAGEKIRLYGQNLGYSPVVKFGTATASAVYEQQNSALLITVPEASKLDADTPVVISVTTKGKLASSVGGGSANSTLTFKRTNDYYNTYNATLLTRTFDATILTGSFNYVRGDNSFALSATTFADVYYVINVPKRSLVSVTVNAIQSAFTYADVSLWVHKEALEVGPATFLGPEGVKPFPNAPSARSAVIGQISESVTFVTDRDNQDVIINVWGATLVGAGLENAGPFEMIVQTAPVAVSSSIAATATPTLKSVSLDPAKWTSTGDGSLLTEAEASPASGGQSWRFGGVGASEEPQILWNESATALQDASQITASFTMALEAGGKVNDDHFAWQIGSTDDSSIGALWVDASTGRISLVEQDGTKHDSIHQMTPGGGSHRIEIMVDQTNSTWAVTMDGVRVSDTANLPKGKKTGEIFGVWDLGSDDQAGGSAVTVTDFTITLE